MKQAITGYITALMSAPSKGNYFYTYIKDKYPYQPLN
ncbi:MAG: KTSC domain-containing protein [Clostridium sporogenes]|nr:KTSC domain-containing protein [Clostridium sporogenes]